MLTGIRRKAQYRFEQFMAKGGSSVFVSLLFAFLVCFALLVLIRALVLWFIGPIPDYNTVKGFSDHVWYIFLQMTDPGNMYQDSDTSGWIRVTTVIAGFTGVILFSALIAFLTTALDNILYEFRKGRGIILEEEHTLILGWNSRIVDILKELIIANESEARASVVICSEHDKEFMDDYIANRLPDTKTTKIITTNGNPSNLSELKRISASTAKSVIILAESSDNAPEEDKISSDTQCIKTIMSLIALQDGENKLPIIAEVLTEQKRDVVKFFDDANIIALDNWDIMGKLLVQTSLTSGLEMVYNEILSFDLNEIYYYQTEWNGITFGELPYHFEDGVPLGICRNGETLELRPDNSTVLSDDDEILILADDNSTIDFKAKKLYEPKQLDYTDIRLEKSSKSILILGWHSVADIFIRECDDYLEEGSSFDVMLHNPNDETKAHIQSLNEEYPDLEIRLHDEDTLVLDNLRKLNPFSYDSILILSQVPDETNTEKIDSDTLMILLLLRKIAREEAVNKSEHKTKIITQVLNSDNQELILQTDVDDFIISNRLISMILAQLSEEPRIKNLYDDIFQEDGSEIYVKPASLYFSDFPVREDFATIMEQARKRDEICLGVRYNALSKNAEANFGVSLNLPKDEVLELTKDDFLVVLAEDEL